MLPSDGHCEPVFVGVGGGFLDFDGPFLVRAFLIFLFGSRGFRILGERDRLGWLCIGGDLRDDRLLGGRLKREVGREEVNGQKELCLPRDADRRERIGK